MGTYRKRWNEKARAGQMAKLKDLKRVRNKQFTMHEDSLQNEDDEPVSIPAKEANPNTELLQPLTAEEKKLKKRKLEELFTPKETKMTRMKKKRLEKFIEHQLKREEKKVLIEKLQSHRIDTSILTSSKQLGQGRKTKKEEFNEALKLERQGRGDEQTKRILYEERDVKDWLEDHPEDLEEDLKKDSDSDSPSSSGDENSLEEHEINTEVRSGGFIDNRPSKFGGFGFGFGFSNVKVVNGSTQAPQRKYNWRQRVEMEEMRKHKIENAMDFDSSSESDGGEGASASVSLLSPRTESQTSAAEERTSDQSDEDEESTSDSDNEYSETNAKKLEKFKHTKNAEEFKDWANKEIKRIEGNDVEYEMPKLNLKYEPIIRIEDLDDGLKEENMSIDMNSKRQTFVVNVVRTEEIQAARIQLPVFAEEHRIMEAIHHNDVVIISGETGSGKTTQVPQFLYESGYGHPDSPDTPGLIGITQPRRVAAVSMASRVSKELGNHSAKVGYQIRFDSSVKKDTRIKFMTDGVLLREMMNDFKLNNYSSIIIDEAHERNINTDILIGMLSRCVRLRAKENAQDPSKHKRLKLVIMSATLRVSDFSENRTLFDTKPPILTVNARQYPVSIHFARHTASDYVDEALRKTCKIHRRLPPGAILVFMTGQQEIKHLVQKLRQEFPFSKDAKRRKEMDTDLPILRFDSKNTDVEVEDIDFSVKVVENQEFDDGIHSTDEEDNVEEGFEEELEEGQSENDPLYVLPLYSLLPTKEQMKVFQDPPKGSRLCVVATNVAETSLTIPGVRYVVDCGRAKERKYNDATGVQSFEIDWISKASADQRSGRAGRTGPGHCYRLYSSAVYEHHFEQFSRPEILRMPVESVVLQMKSMLIHNVVNFPFPTPPDSFALAKAVELLQYLGALDETEKITADGRKMSLFPLSPRFSKMLLVSNEHDCLPYVVSIVSGLSVGDPFISEHELGIKHDDAEDTNSDSKEHQRELRAKFYKSKAKFSKLDKNSDVFRLLSVISAMDYIPPEKKNKFIEQHFLRGKVMEEISKLRKQVMYIIKSNTSKENIACNVSEQDLKASIPSEIQIKLLKQMVCSGFIDQIAIRADKLFPDDAQISNKTTITDIPYVPVLSHRTNDIADCFVYLHSSSVITNLGKEPPNYLVYHSLHLNTNSHSPKTRMKPLCDIKSTPLANVARTGSLLTYSKPLTGKGFKPIDLSPTERYCYVTPRFGSTVDSDIKLGWDLNPVAVHQRKEQGRWLTTKFITNSTFKKNAIKNKH
ncbi:ATP-dependent RNA helicase ECM16 Ecym_6076 [Eremothecium cymbalariae DBVPG|uniref:RNA helicase n=1 Tax=Eremothecium cymbalariae (strain CBS 270.75 / DBVPG 7215 / KCTC 17166 / NRRL Y-17582) TaxID=931890 RepID=G8JUZ5_ERECY|nr:hypothetical protein Ecym_6076 [Eremothecium cymbalariae DBVPG\